MKAKAVVFTKPNTVEFQEVSCREPGPDDVIIRVTYSWISCGTEGSYLRGERIGGDLPYRLGDPMPFPIVPGYQKIGVVECVGENIKDIELGEIVFNSVGYIDNMYFEVGGHINPTVCPRDAIVKIPADMEPLAFAGLLLTQVGYNCGSRAPIEENQFAVVIGDGPVAQWTAQTLKHRGAKVIMVGMLDERLTIAKQLACHETINITKTDWIEQIGRIAPEEIAMAVDCAGSKDSTDKIIEVMSRGGNIVSAGFYGTDDKISLQKLRDRELSINSVSGLTPERMLKTRDLVAAGTLETLPLITHHFPAQKAAQAWQLINARKEHVLGVILDW
jgi:2-desacetyl-2-hydroxyethyl bacteriochlorophyllide A dehydrogenase